MSKETAVEWFVKELFKKIDYIQVDPKLIEQAIAMEKEQMEQADINGYDRKQYQHDTQYGGAEYWDVEPKDFEQYYNETYRGDK